MKRILITGSNGLLGSKLVRKISENPAFLPLFTSPGSDRNNLPADKYSSLDIRDAAAVEKVIFDFKPQVLIHAGAMTQVDACETDPPLCNAINVVGTENIAALQKMASPELNPHLIFVSTDFIFDGKKGPYSETDKPNPLSVYGKSKLNAEILVQKSGLPWSIARTVLVYGYEPGLSRTNFLLWIKSSLEKNSKIKVVKDQVRTPTLAEDLADGLLAIAGKSALGIFNLSGPDGGSIYEIALRIAEFWKLNSGLIEPVLTKDLSQPAPRPPVTGFVIEKAREILGFNPKSFAEGMLLVDAQLKKLKES
jgi:dTDP-4-dehydrorhamnose reductase